MSNATNSLRTIADHLTANARRAGTNITIAPACRIYDSAQPERVLVNVDGRTIATVWLASDGVRLAGSRASHVAKFVSQIAAGRVIVDNG